MKKSTNMKKYIAVIAATGVFGVCSANAALSTISDSETGMLFGAGSGSVNNTTNYLNGIVNAVNANTSGVSTLTTDLGTAEGKLTNANTLLGADLSDTSSVQTALTGTIAGNATTITGAINAIDTAVSTNTTNITQNANDISALDTRVDTAEGKLTNANTLLGADLSDTSSVQTALTGTIAGNATTITGAINAVDTAVSTNTTNITQNANDISALDTRVDTAENNITTLQNDMYDAQERLKNAASTLGIDMTDIDSVQKNLTGPNAGGGKASTLVGAVNVIDAAVGVNATKLANAGNALGIDLSDASAMDDALTGPNATGKTNFVDAVNTIDAAVGDLSTFNGLLTGSSSVVEAALRNADNIGNMSFNGAASSSLSLTEAINANQAWAQGEFNALGNRIQGVSDRVDDLSDELRASLAAANAMSALVPNARSVGNTQLSIGTGGYRDQVGVAAGLFHYVSDGALLNAAVSYGTGKQGDLGWRAGITFGF
ncbi:MAG: YadA C-terminal domain-containing protein [Rickettsiales bacterium]|nr:YadA C-terminal domain-containing protein [Rickettsiales bacterium]